MDWNLSRNRGASQLSATRYERHDAASALRQPQSAMAGMYRMLSRIWGLDVGVTPDLQADIRLLPASDYSL
jgi:hypothetical protein